MTLESTAHWSSWFRICWTVIIWDFKGKIILIITILLIIIPLLLLLLPPLLLLFSSLFLYESFEIYWLSKHSLYSIPSISIFIKYFFFIAQRHRLYLQHSHFIRSEKSCISSPYPHISFRDRTSQGAWTSWGWSRRAIRGHRPDWGGCGGGHFSPDETGLMPGKEHRAGGWEFLCRAAEPGGPEFLSYHTSGPPSPKHQPGNLPGAWNFNSQLPNRALTGNYKTDL